MLSGKAGEVDGCCRRTKTGAPFRETPTGGSWGSKCENAMVLGFLTSAEIQGLREPRWK